MRLPVSAIILPSSLPHYSAKIWPQRRNRQTRIRGARYTIRRAGNATLLL